MVQASQEMEHRAKQVHERALVVDACVMDYVFEKEYTDRLVTGGVNAAFVTCHKDTFDDTINNLDRVRSEIERRPEDLMLALTAADVQKANTEGKVAIVLAFQDTLPIGEDPTLLRTFYRLGVRVIQLTYTGGNIIGDGCGERTNRGLTYNGIELVKEMNRLGILIDLSHCGDATTMDGIEASDRPVAFTHANARALRKTARNKTDEQYKALVAKGGVVGLTPHPGFTTDKGSPTLEHFLDQIDYVKSLIGVDHVGLGLDFTEGMREKGEATGQIDIWRTRRPDIFGTLEDFFKTPYAEGIEGIAKLPDVTRGLVQRGYSDSEIEKVLGGNWMRLFEEVCG